MITSNPTGSDVSRRRVGPTWLTIAGTLVGVAVLLATGIVAYYKGESHAIASLTHSHDFPDSLRGSPTDVSYQDAFRHHDIQLPAEVSNLEYQARSDLDGYPVFADFGMPCAEKPGCVQVNHLTEVTAMNVPDFEDLNAFSSLHGAPFENTRNYWYERPAGTAATVQVLIDESPSCHVYLTAVDHY